MNLILGNFLSQITKTCAVDLHTHSTASDGSYTAQEIYNLAKSNQLNYFSLTDHDTIAGNLYLLKRYPTVETYLNDANQDLDWLIKQSQNKTIQQQLLLIPGIEFSVSFEDQEVHLLAYYSGRDIEKLSGFMKTQRDARYKRNRKMLKRLNDLKIPIPLDELNPSPKQPVTGRVKVAKWLVANHYADSIAEAFVKFLAKGKSAYIPRKKFELSYVLELISQSNGFPCIAHPHQYKWTQSEEYLDKKIKKLSKLALIGVEVFHSNASLEEQKLMLKIANKYSLPYTAGSDFHGENKEEHEMYTASHKAENHFGKIK